MVPKLKVLQITGNPVIYPTQEIINEGVVAIKAFLKKQYNSTHKMQESSEANLEIKCILTQKDQSNVVPAKQTLKPILKSKNYRNESKIALPRYKLKSSSKSQCSSIYKDHIGKANKHLNCKNIGRRIDEKLEKDLWMMRLKDIMSFQDGQLQKAK